MFYRGLHGRVTKLETDVAAIGTDVKDVQALVVGFGGKMDEVVKGLSSTDGRAAERAQAVKAEMRDEGERRAREKSDLFKNGLALLGAVGMVVGVVCGPYISQLGTTARGQADDAYHIGQVRETQAQQGADINRAQVAIDLTRERNHLQDAELREHDQDLAFIRGVLASKGWPTR